MATIKNISSAGVLAAFAAVALTGCSSDSPSPAPAVNMPIMSFTIAVDNAAAGNGASTRAAIGETAGQDWGSYNPQDPGFPFDCAVKEDNFSVALFNPSTGAYEGQLIGLFPFGQRSEENVTEYKFTGMIDLRDKDTDLSSGEHTYRMMVAANLSAPFDASVQSAGDLVFSYAGQEGDFPAVPMWGVSTVTLKDLVPNKVNELQETVSLLRAMAMVKVTMAPQNDDRRTIEMTGLTFSRHNPEGYVAPEGWDQAGKTESITLQNTIREIKGDGDSRKVFTAPSDNKEGIKSFRIYLPEIKNNEGDDEVVMTVAYTIGDGSGKSEEHTGEIRFRPYEDGVPEPGKEPWDIVRNHIYDFAITGVEPSTKRLNVNVAVKDWKNVIYELEY